MAVGREGRRIRQHHPGQLVQVPQRRPGELQRRSTPPRLRGSLTVPLKATRVLPERKSPCSGNGSPRCAAPACRRFYRCPAAAARYRSPSPAGQKYSLRLLPPLFALLAAHLAEGQRLAERIDQDRDIRARHLVINGDPSAIEQNIIQAERPAGRGGPFGRRGVGGQRKGPVIIFSDSRIRRASGCSSLIHGR
jgi:hypothetical protein